VAGDFIPDDEQGSQSPPPPPADFISDEDMAQQTAAPQQAAPEFISDEDMKQQSAAPQQASPDFISDADMAKPALTAESPTMTAGREAASDIIPTVGSIPAMTAGARIGGAIGMATPVPGGTFIGMGLGALAGGLLAGGALAKAQDIVKRVLGMDDTEQRRVNAEANPNAAMLGSVPGVVAGFKSGAWKGGAAIASHLTTGAFMGGVTAATQVASGEDLNAKAIALSAAEGGVFNEVRGGIPAKLAKLGDTVADRIIKHMGHGTPGPLAASGVAQEATPVKEDVPGLGNTDTQPGERDGGNDGSYAKKAPISDGSTTVENVDNGVSQEFQDVLSTLNKDENTGAPAATAANENVQAEAAPAPAANDNIPNAPEQVTGAAMRDTASGRVEQGDNHNDAVKKLDDAPRAEPISKNLPSLEAQHAQDIEPSINAKAQADALAQVQADRIGTDEPLTDKEKAAPERQAKPTTADDGTLPAKATLTSYEAPGVGDSYPHVDPSMAGVLIRRGHPAPNMVGSNRANTEVLIDPRVPRVLDAQTTDGKTKSLDPAQALAIRENTRRQILDMLSKEPNQKMPFATQLEAAKEAGLLAEHHWLEQRGYDADAFKAKVEGFKTAPLPAKAPVTATVNYPKFVTRTLEKLRAKGLEDQAVGLETKIKGMAPKDQIAEAGTASAKFLISRNPEALTAEQLAKPLKNPRLEQTGAEVGNRGYTATNKTLAAHHDQALKAGEKAFEKNPPPKAKTEGEPPPVETKAELRARLTKAVGEAKTANGGMDPISDPKGKYRPRDPDAAWHWLNEAKLLIQGRMTAKQIAKFVGTENLLRGSEEDIAAYKAEKRGAGETAMNARSGDAAVAGAEAKHAAESIGRPEEFPGETPHEEAEKDTPPVPVQASELIPAARKKELDIATVERAKQADILAEMKPVVEKMVNKPDDLTGQPKKSLWKAESADVTARAADLQENMAKQKRAREAKILAAKTATKAPEAKPGEVRKVEVTPELAAKYAGLPKEQARQAQHEADLQALEAGNKEDPTANPLKTLWSSEEGSVNPKAIAKTLNAPMSKTSDARGSRSVAEDYANSLSDKFAALRGEDGNDLVAARKAARALPDAVQAIDGKLYKAQDENTVQHLNKNDESLFNRWIKPHLDRADTLFNNIEKLAPGLLGPKVDSHVWRQRIGGAGDELSPNTMHTGVSGDPVEGTTNPLYSGKVGPMYERSMVGLERSDGKRFVISPSEKGGFLSWEGGSPRMVKDPSFTFKDGDTYTNGTKTYKMVQATTAEIEAQTGVKYYKSAIMSAIMAEMRLSSIARHLQYLENLKASPEFTGGDPRQLATQNPKLARENGWQTTELKAFDGWYMHPRLAEVMDDFQRPGFGAADTAWDKVRRFSQQVTKLLFWLPTAHVENVGAHWFTARGLEWLRPRGYKSLVMDGGDAARSVMTQDQFQMDMRKHGAGLIYGSTVTEDIVGQIAKAAGVAIERDPATYGPIAKTLGVGVDDMVKGIYSASKHAMWYTNDVMLTQLVKEQMRNGLSMPEAIVHAEKYFPNYRVASRLMGSRLISKVMQSPELSAFGRYHGGVFKAYANVAKDLLNPNATGKQRTEAVGHLMMMGALMFGVYPVLDKAAKWLTDNPDASLYRRGPAAIPNVLLRAAQGHGDISQTLRDTFTVPPLVSTLDEVRQNMDYAHKPIMEPGDVTQALHGSGKAAARVAVQQGVHAAAGMISPVGTAINASKNQGIPAAIRDQLLGIKNPSIRARIYDKMEVAKNQKSSIARFANPRTNPVEGWLNKLMGSYK